MERSKGLGSDMILNFDSTEDMARSAGENPSSTLRYLLQSHGPRWTANLTYDQTYQRGLSGDESLVDKARALLDKIDTDIVIPTRQWTPSPFGAYPCVPDYLAGFPDAMRVRAPVEDFTPIRIYASIAATADTKATDMERRGVAILALVMKLQEQGRIVDLYVTCPWTGPDVVLVAKINTRPLDLATACFAIAHPAYFRALGHAVLYNTSPRHSTSPMRASAVRYALGLGPHDLYLETLISWGGADLILSNPTAWICAQLKALSGPQ